MDRLRHLGTSFRDGPDLYNTACRDYEGRETFHRNYISHMIRAIRFTIPFMNNSLDDIDDRMCIQFQGTNRSEKANYVRTVITNRSRNKQFMATRAFHDAT